MPFPAPADLLLHLIDHAAYEHRFDNGPLVLSDLSYLIETHTIDWQSFWRQAQQAGRTRAALLTLRMVGHYFGGHSIEWPEKIDEISETMDALVDRASLLTLQNFESRGDALLMRDVRMQSTVWGKFGIFLGKAFPSRRKMAMLYPISEHSLRIYFFYAANLWRLAVVRLPEYMASRGNKRVSDEAHRMAGLEQWLSDRAAVGDTKRHRDNNSAE